MGTERNRIEVGRTVEEVRIRKMKARRGSCNVEARRVWLNLELVKKPVSCLEYILVHELVHLHERRHTERFQALLKALMPTWRRHREGADGNPQDEDISRISAR